MSREYIEVDKLYKGIVDGAFTTEGSWEKPEKKFCHECGAKMDKEG